MSAEVGCIKLKYHISLKKIVSSENLTICELCTFNLWLTDWDLQVNTGSERIFVARRFFMAKQRRMKSETRFNPQSHVREPHSDSISESSTPTELIILAGCLNNIYIFFLKSFLISAKTWLYSFLFGIIQCSSFHFVLTRHVSFILRFSFSCDSLWGSNSSSSWSSPATSTLSLLSSSSSSRATVTSTLLHFHHGWCFLYVRVCIVDFSYI